MIGPAPQRIERFSVFRPRFRPSQRVLRGFTPVAPWIDFLLIFLMFLLARFSFVVQPGIAMDLPVAPATQGVRYDALVVSIPREGAYFFRDARVTTEGLAAALADAARADTNTTLIVEADARVSHGALVGVYNLARQAGIREILLASRPPRP